MDREGWDATVHGVARSQTRLSDWTELLVFFGIKFTFSDNDISRFFFWLVVSWCLIPSFKLKLFGSLCLECDSVGGGYGQDVTTGWPLSCVWASRSSSPLPWAWDVHSAHCPRSGHWVQGCSPQVTVNITYQNVTFVWLSWKKSNNKFWKGCGEKGIFLHCR